MGRQRSAAAKAPATTTRAHAPARKATPAPQPADLDRLLHDRMRLAIVSALAASPSLSFTELRTITDATDGNLSVHARKLEEAGYLTCEKGYDGRTPRTEFRLTADGRRAFQRYLDHMEAIIRHARTSVPRRGGA